MSKYNEISYLKDNPLDKYNLANCFEVVLKGLNSYFNICKTLRFAHTDNILPKYYKNYVVTDKDTWTNISYKFFKTYKLWWLICKFNDVVDPFSYLTLGKVIKIPTELLVNDIIINQMDKL